MAVIIREERIVGGQRRSGIRVYKSERPVGAPERQQADRLDAELAAGMERIAGELRSIGVLDLKGRPGVVRLWWELGRRLRELLPRLDYGHEEDRKFLWRAIYDHAQELVPGKVGSRAERYENSHFKYCYELGQFSWEAVEGFGDWTSWVEFFDSEPIRADERIATWLRERLDQPPSAEWAAYMTGNRMDWFREVAKRIRAKLRGRDSTGLTDAELYEELDSVVSDIVRDQRGAD